MKTTCLVDSGSQISTVSDSYYKKYLAERIPLQALETLVRIEAANGSLIPYSGYAQVSMDLSPILTNCRQSFRALLFVCPDTAYSREVPVLLGTNVIGEMCDRTDKGSLKVTQLAGLLRTYRTNRKICDDDEGCVGKVKVMSKRAVVILPGETTTVRCRCIAKNLGRPYPAIMEAAAVTSQRYIDGVTVPSVLITVPQFARTTLLVPVMNLTGRTIALSRKNILADLYIPNWIRSVGHGDTTFTGTVTGENVLPQCLSHGCSDVKSPPATDMSYLEACRIGSELPEQWKDRVMDLMTEYSDVFSKHDLDVGHTSAVRHKINLVDDTPFRERSRPIAARDVMDARKHIQELLDADIIQPSNSPFASPIVLVRKKSGALRLTVDYRKLNKKTIKDAYCLPRIDEAFGRLSGAKWFSVMDLKSGYYQVDMAPEDREKTAFVCPLGFYEFNRLPQGVTNAPATFQRLMEQCMGSQNLIEVLVFLDDLIVYSRTLEEHEANLRQVLQRLREFGLNLSPGKCEFFCKTVSYLGHLVSEDGIRCDPSKVEAVRDWPRPDNMKELKSYLGFASYYRKFISGFSVLAQPLNALLKGYTRLGPNDRMRTDHAAVRKPFRSAWTAECEEAFLALKDKLGHAPVLAIADPHLPYELHTDASAAGLGAALYQKQNGVLRPVAYASRSLSVSESRYPAHKLEFLALKWATCDKFHDFLYGAKFRVITDNNPLTYVLTSARLDAMGHRWLATLSTYDFDIKYRAGQLNADADGLSRRPHSPTDVIDPVQERQDRRIANLLENTRPLQCAETIVDANAIVTAVLEGDAIPAVQCLPIIDDAVLDGDLDEHVQCMPSISRQEQRDAQLEDQAIATVRTLLAEEIPLTGELRQSQTRAVSAILRGADNLYFQQGVLFKKSTIAGQQVQRLVVPLSLRPLVYRGIHDEVGHLGSERGVALARSRFYWYRMEDDIKAYCQKCVRCVLRKTPPPRAAYMSSLQSSDPMDLLCIDFLKVDADRWNRTNILVVTDHFTRFARAIPTRNQTAKAVAEALWKEFFLDFGFPRRLHSDRGASFTGQLVKQLCALTGIQGSLTTPYHPQGNSQVERFNRSLIQMLGTMTDEQKMEWSKHVKYLEHAYNCTQHESTGYSPFYLMFMRNPRLQVDWLFDVGPEQETRKPDLAYVNDVQEGLAQAYEVATRHALDNARRNKRRYDKRVRPSGLAVGSRVLARNVALTGKRKLANNWLPDVYRVVKQQGGEGSPVYVIRREDGKKGDRTLHRNMLLPCDILPLEAETKHSRPVRRRENRGDEQSPVEDAGPETVRLWFDESSSDDDEVIYERPARTRPQAPPTGDEECSSDDEPLIRRLRPALVHHAPVDRRLSPSSPAVESELDSDEREVAARRHGDDHAPSEDAAQDTSDGPPSSRPRRETRPPRRLEYDWRGRPWY